MSANRPLIRTAVRVVKQLPKGVSGWVGVAVLTFKQWGGFVYNLLDAAGNVDYLLDNYRVVIKFLETGWGTLTLVSIGTGLILLRVYQVSRKLMLAGGFAPALPQAERRTLAPRTPPTTQGQPSGDVQAIVWRLREFRAQGDRLLNQAAVSMLEPTIISHWEQETASYIREQRGESEATAFLTGRILNYPFITANRRESDRVYTRLARLDEIISRL
jgi:hypothetical protein